jgi:hypothetical protein
MALSDGNTRHRHSKSAWAWGMLSLAAPTATSRSRWPRRPTLYRLGIGRSGVLASARLIAVAIAVMTVLTSAPAVAQSPAPVPPGVVVDLVVSGQDKATLKGTKGTCQLFTNQGGRAVQFLFSATDYPSLGTGGNFNFIATESQPPGRRYSVGGRIGGNYIHLRERLVGTSQETGITVSPDYTRVTLNTDLSNNTVTMPYKGLTEKTGHVQGTIRCGPAPEPGVNQAPIAVDDSYKIPAGGTLKVRASGILRNDSDPDGDPLTVIPGQHTTLASNTKVGADGSMRLEFPAGWNGNACLAYTLSDGRGGVSAPAHIRVKVGKPTGIWANDQCERLADDAPPPVPSRQAKSGYHWTFLWSIGAPPFSFVLNRYRALCQQSQGTLFVSWGRWWNHYNCWRWGPYQRQYL